MAVVLLASTEATVVAVEAIVEAAAEVSTDLREGRLFPALPCKTDLTMGEDAYAGTLCGLPRWFPCLRFCHRFWEPMQQATG